MVCDTLPSQDAPTHINFGIPTSKNIGDMRWKRSGTDALTVGYFLGTYSVRKRKRKYPTNPSNFFTE